MKTPRLDSKIYQFIKNSCIAVLVMGTAILFSACENNDIDKIQAFSSPENLPIMEANNFETLRTDSGVIRYLLKAPKFLQFENDGKSYWEFPQGVHIEEYNSNNEITSTLRADYAKYFTKDKKWEAKNNVVITNVKGDSLKTEHLLSEEKTGKIHTDEFVKIISADKIITGVGLVADQNMQNWRIKNPKGTIYVSVDNEQKQRTKKQPRSEPENIPQDTRDKPLQFN